MAANNPTTSADATAAFSAPHPSKDTATPLPHGDDLVNRAATSAHAAIDKLAEKAAPRVQRLSVKLDQANQRLRERGEQARDTGADWAESLRCSVREHPLAAVGAALTAGMLLASLSR